MDIRVSNLVMVFTSEGKQLHSTGIQYSRPVPSGKLLRSSVPGLPCALIDHRFSQGASVSLKGGQCAAGSARSPKFHFIL
jgi:hypothetical protein